MTPLELVSKIASRGGAADFAETDLRIEGGAADQAVQDGWLVREAVGGDVGLTTRLRLTTEGRDLCGLPQMTLIDRLKAWWAPVPFVGEGEEI